MARLTSLLPALLFAAAPALAEIFKCADRNGMDRYQNFPCAIDSLASLPTSWPVANPRPPVGPGHAQPAAMPAALAAAGSAAKAIEPRIGMTVAEVTAIWGEPLEVEQDEPKEGRIEIWRYGGGKSVQFSNKHRVSAVQQ